MPCTVHSFTLVGIDGQPVAIEVDLLHRLPATIIVGLPGSAIKESTHRVRSAIAASGQSYPKKCVVVNLAPANVPKVGAGLDLPIALGILYASRPIDSPRLLSTAFAGELSLDGGLRAIPGALSMTLAAVRHGFKHIVLPQASAKEAAVVEGIDVLPATTLLEVMDWLDGNRTFVRAEPPCHDPPVSEIDMSEIRGQHQARRGLEIAAAGGHNVLMMGAPGCGKTMLATRMPTILPKLERAESIEITRLHSAAGLLNSGDGLIRIRPFRAPHHSISNAGLLGNARLEPGEVSLAHRGVLFLDEVPEFRRSALELLRGPLESRHVRLSRARGTTVYPASFSLIAAANPCPCGFFGHSTVPCSCTPSQVVRYRKRLSGPLLDRIDLMIWTQPVDPDQLASMDQGEPSMLIRKRVNAARAIQHARYSNMTITCNAELSGGAIRSVAAPTPEAVQALKAVCEANSLSARAWARILKVARTIADLAGVGSVSSTHILEASSYRLMKEAK